MGGFPLIDSQGCRCTSGSRFLEEQRATCNAVGGRSRRQGGGGALQGRRQVAVQQTGQGWMEGTHKEEMTLWFSIA